MPKRERWNGRVPFFLPHPYIRCLTYNHGAPDWESGTFLCDFGTLEEVFSALWKRSFRHSCFGARTQPARNKCFKSCRVVTYFSNLKKIFFWGTVISGYRQGIIQNREQRKVTIRILKYISTGLSIAFVLD